MKKNARKSKDGSATIIDTEPVVASGFGLAVEIATPHEKDLMVVGSLFGHKVMLRVRLTSDYAGSVGQRHTPRRALVTVNEVVE